MGIRQELQQLAEEEMDREISFLFKEDDKMQAILVDQDNLEKLLGGSLPELEDEEETVEVQKKNQQQAQKNTHVSISPQDCKVEKGKTSCVKSVK